MISKRLAALEAKLVRPPEAEPVDLGPWLADVVVSIVAHHDGRRKPKEAKLTAFARALGVTVPKLWKIVTTKPKVFAERLLAVRSHERDVEAVRHAVIREFVADEIHHCGTAGEFDNLTHALIAEVGWEMIWRGIERGVLKAQPARALCRVRPLRGDKVP